MLKRREAGLENYKKYLNQYFEKYQNYKDKLINSIDVNVLMDFIIEQSASNPIMLVDLAKALNVENTWQSYPVRVIIGPDGSRVGY